jgi:hypothetical protein
VARSYIEAIIEGGRTVIKVVDWECDGLLFGSCNACVAPPLRTWSNATRKAIISRGQNGGSQMGRIIYATRNAGRMGTNSPAGVMLLSLQSKRVTIMRIDQPAQSPGGYVRAQVVHALLRCTEIIADRLRKSDIYLQVAHSGKREYCTQFAFREVPRSGRSHSKAAIALLRRPCP